MRILFRWISFSAAGLLAVLSPIFNQNIEEFSTSMGWNSFFKDGWRVVTELGLASWITYGFFLFAGASLALWIDHWLRRWGERKADLPTNARLMLTWEDGWDMSLTPGHENIHHWYSEAQGPHVLIVIGFDTPIQDGHIQVASNVKGMRWKESGMSDRHAVVTVEGRQPHCFIHVEIVSPSATRERRQQEDVWQDAIHFEEAGILGRVTE